MQASHSLKTWVREIQDLCQPKAIQWCDGSEQESQLLLQQMIDQGSCIRLNPAKRPNSYLFRSDPRDVARVEGRTFISTRNEKDAGPTNNWRDPVQLKEELKQLYKGCMQGRTLYIIPFCMGPLDSPLAKIGVELSDSPYVVINMRLMARMGKAVLDRIEAGTSFIPCLHSVGKPLKDGEKDVSWPCDPDNVCVAHFPEERAIYAYGSGYGGNALLGKKCLSLRIASYLGKTEGWLAEHMLILGLESPEKEKKYFAAAFPSACGKTNFAMLIPPPAFSGWKVTTVGDDIAWLKADEEGVLRAINPEAGFFGVAPGTSPKTNPNALQACAKDTIFTNVALTDEGDIWWEGLTDTPPDHLVDWLGQDWTPGCGRLAAQANSRFTAPIKNCPSLDEAFEDPRGVPIAAIIYGGRRMSDVPLVLQSFNWTHGVYLGATMASERTAAAEGREGELRHDPMAMLPFCGYNIGDYFAHHIALGNALESKPPIFHVNWFRKSQQGKFLWPGFGENIRVLKWIFARCSGRASAKETAIGWLPSFEDLDWNQLVISREIWDELMSIEPKGWIHSWVDNSNFFASLFDRLPKELLWEHESLLSRLKK